MTRYQDRFIEVLAYIESNLDDDLDIEQLCQSAHLSKYHFHRQCSAYFGLSVISLVRLLRLKRAAYQLAYRDDMNILEIACASGYDSHEAFSRAFKKVLSCTPSTFRQTPNWTSWQTKYEPILQLREKTMKQVKPVDVKIVDFPAINMAVMEHRGAPNLLGQTIASFIQWRKQNELPPSRSRTFNLVYDDPAITPPQDYRFDLGCEIKNSINNQSDNIVNKMIPAGLCAVIRHIGSDDGLASVVNDLYGSWLDESDYETRDFPLFFERVRFFPDVAENETITDVYLPVQALSN